MDDPRATGLHSIGNFVLKGSQVISGGVPDPLASIFMPLWRVTLWGNIRWSIGFVVCDLFQNHPDNIIQGSKRQLKYLKDNFRESCNVCEIKIYLLTI